MPVSQRSEDSDVNSNSPLSSNSLKDRNPSETTPYYEDALTYSKYQIFTPDLVIVFQRTSLPGRVRYHNVLITVLIF